MESDDGVVQAVGVPGMRVLELGWVESDLDDGIDKLELVVVVGPFGADKGGGGTEAVIRGPINRSTIKKSWLLPFLRMVLQFSKGQGKLQTMGTTKWFFYRNPMRWPKSKTDQNGLQLLPDAKIGP